MSKLYFAIVVIILIASVSCNRADSKTSADSQKAGEGRVVLKGDPSEMDCKQAEQAHADLLKLEATGRVIEIEPKMSLAEYKSKLEKKLEECKGAGTGKAYRVNGQSNNVSFTGEICSLDKPFTIDAKFPGGTAKTTFTPGGSGGGSTSVSGGGNGCTHSGGGTFTLTAGDSPILNWTTSDTIACPGFSNSRTATFKLTLQPATDLSCP